MLGNKRGYNARTQFRLECKGQFAGQYGTWPHRIIDWLKEKRVYYRLFRGDQLVDEA